MVSMVPISMVQLNHLPTVMRAGRKVQAPVLSRRVVEREPQAHRVLDRVRLRWLGGSNGSMAHIVRWFKWFDGSNVSML